MNIDMTANKPIKVITQFGLSILFGNLFQQLYNMVDSIIVGKILGVGALAAVGSTGTLNFLVLGFVVGMSTGFGIPVAHFIGARDKKNLKSCIINSVYLSLVISVLVTIVTVASAKWLLNMMRTPPDIYDDAYAYIVVIFAGLGSAMFYNLLTSISRAMGDVRTPLIFLIVASIINAVLDYILVKFTSLRTAGAAYATVIAQVLAAAGCFWVMYRRHEILHLKKEECRFDPRIAWRLIRIGLPMAVQFSVTAVGTIIVQTAVNMLGSIFVAGVTTALRIQNVLTQPLEAMGLTLATYCGQNFGAGKMERIKKGVFQSLLLCFAISGLLLLIILGFGRGFTGIFIAGENPELTTYALRFMMWNAAFFWALGILLILRNAIQGLGYAGAAIFAGVFETAGRVIVALGLAGTWGYTAVCFANPVAWIFADILLITVYFIIMKKEYKRK